MRNCILHYAQVAADLQPKFERMMSQTCLRLAVSTLAGLKLNPNNPNEKALLRIQEKIFFRGEQAGEKAGPGGGRLEEGLREEEAAYQQRLGRLLAGREQVVFSVSDMVRGKCTFTSISDIIQTVKDIRRYCEETPGFRVTEVESRFGNKVPISDVTLKIVLDEKIVSELQLTLQTNAAAYHFAHIVYEIARSKVFSKCKMVDNMFKENEQRIGQLVNRALELEGQGAMMPQRHSAVRRALGVQEGKTKLWLDAVKTAIGNNSDLKKDA